MREKRSSGFANNKGTDQPAHLCRLIGTIVLRFLECIMSKLATSEISIFYLVSEAEETGLTVGWGGGYKRGCGYTA